jgi:tRNA-splicing ligase RtcB (3'-phosphate/5'-hydroxy nucleic acid ligase)
MGRVSEKITTFLPWPEIEPEAQKQILNVSELPFVFKWVAVMPDCHYGKGATVGTVIATKGAIVPAAVGVDIGCGMIALQTPLKREDLTAAEAAARTARHLAGRAAETSGAPALMKSLHSLREGIERRIPMSAGRNNSKITESAQARIAELKKVETATGANYHSFHNDWERALGTLGGGNHFAEVCVDENDSVWLTLHSGSRGVGNKIGNHYIRRAQEICKRSGIALPDRDLAYLSEGTEEFDNYMRDLRWAQMFAHLNRDEMMDRMLRELSHHIYGEGEHESALEISRINCHHNFTQIEHHFGQDVWVTRKGAIEARQGMRGMIPGSMGTRSYVVTGLGNEQAFQSAPHGAGRRMSRTKARASYTMKDLEGAMAGIEFRKAHVLLDEIPAAYKDIDRVMEYSRELVRIDHTLRQVINCKGN